MLPSLPTRTFSSRDSLLSFSIACWGGSPSLSAAEGCTYSLWVAQCGTADIPFVSNSPEDSITYQPLGPGTSDNATSVARSNLKLRWNRESGNLHIIHTASTSCRKVPFNFAWSLRRVSLAREPHRHLVEFIGSHGLWRRPAAPSFAGSPRLDRDSIRQDLAWQQESKKKRERIE